MAALSDYVTGTITLTNGSADFTGVATGWLLAGFKEGDTIIDVTGATEYMGVVASIDANGAGTLTKPWEGPSLTNAAYRMRYQPDGARVSAQARNLIELLGNGNIQAEAAIDGTGGNWLSYFTGAGTKARTALTEFGRSLIGGTNADDARTALGFTAIGSAVATAADGDAILATLGINSSDIIPQGRVTLQPGVAVPISDTINATAIRYTPAVGKYVPIWDGSQMRMHDIGAGLSMTLDADSSHTVYHQISTLYDLYIILVAGVPRLATASPWQNDKSPGIGGGWPEAELWQGVWVNKNGMTFRYGPAAGDLINVAPRGATLVGSFMVDGIAGTATDSLKDRLLCNVYNQVERPLRVTGLNAPYVYGTNTWRLAGGRSTSRVRLLQRFGGAMAKAKVVMSAHNNGTATTSDVQLLASIGIDVTTGSNASLLSGGLARYGSKVPASAVYEGFPGVGLTTFNLLEWAYGANVAGSVVTWGDSPSEGLIARVLL